MLAGTTRAVFIYHRCKRVKLDTGSRLSFAPPAGLTSFSRRWQSAVPCNPGTDHVDDGDNPDGDSVESEREASLASPVTDHPRRRYGPWHRRWQPNPTAQLGVTSLGNPAEVLMLPSRDRVIPQVPETEVDGDSKPSLQDTIDSERAPLTGHKLKQHIEQIRAKIGKQRGELEKDEWQPVKKALTDGFTNLQLQAYIRAFGGLDRGKWPNTNGKKDMLARLIAEEVWGFVIPSPQKIPGRPEKHAQSFHPVSDTAKLELMLMDPAQPLKKIAENFDVKLDVLLAKSRYALSGLSTDIQKARTAVAAQLQSMQSLQVPLSGHLTKPWQEPGRKHYLSEWLHSLERQYAVKINWIDDSLGMVHRSNSQTLQQVRRDILSSVLPPSGWQKTLIWPELDDSLLEVQPVKTPKELSVVSQSQTLGRLKSSAYSQGGHRLRNSTSTSDVLTRAFFVTTKGQVFSNRQDPYWSQHVEFGQALLPLSRPSKSLSLPILGTTGAVKADPQRKSIPVPHSVGVPEVTIKASKEIESDRAVALGNEPSASDFVGNVPFLSQHISRLHAWDNSAANTAHPGQQIIAVELVPTASPGNPLRSSLPSFNIHFRAIDGTSGKHSRLDVRAITAVHYAKSILVQCPQDVVDLRFREELRQDLLSPSEKWNEPESDHQLLKAAIRQFGLAASKSQTSDWKFRPFVNIPLSESLRRVRARMLTNPGPERPSAGSQSPVKEEILSKVEYVLQSVEVIDVASYRVPVNLKYRVEQEGVVKHGVDQHDFCLDHISYTGPEYSRQVIRLSQQPFLLLPALRTPPASLFIKAALQLAMDFSQNPQRGVLETDSLNDLDFVYDHERAEEAAAKVRAEAATIKVTRPTAAQLAADAAKKAASTSKNSAEQKQKAGFNGSQQKKEAKTLSKATAKADKGQDAGDKTNHPAKKSAKKETSPKQPTRPSASSSMGATEKPFMKGKKAVKPNDNSKKNPGNASMSKKKSSTSFITGQKRRC
jgi:hypothetical protein